MGVVLASFKNAEVVTLRDLAAEINEQHALAEGAAETALGHALAAGAALLNAKEAIPHGSWQEWIALNFKGTRLQAANYMRLAYYRALLPPGTTIRQALKALRGEQPLLASNTRPPSMRAMARKLRDEEGLGAPEVAEKLGVDKATIWRWWRLETPESKRYFALYERRRRERGRLARRALLAEEQANAAKRIGGELAECYSLIRRAVQATDAQRELADTQEKRFALNSAVEALYNAEDALARALKLPGYKKSNGGTA